MNCPVVAISAMLRMVCTGSSMASRRVGPVAKQDPTEPCWNGVSIPDSTAARVASSVTSAGSMPMVWLTMLRAPPALGAVSSGASTPLITAAASVAVSGLVNIS